jgi:hypothetical protein
MINTYILIIERDGDMWCAHDENFINLQESFAEFGKTPAEAASIFLEGIEETNE